MSFYGIYIPNNNDNDENLYVFTDKKEAFKILKTQKEARLKEFKTNDEAVNFAKHGLAVLPINTSLSQSSPSITLDKSPYRGPKSQELVAFRKLIEQGKLDAVRETIWANPRYLIGSGDTPTILKESTRYNALHVAVLAKNAKMCELLLRTVGDPMFIELIHCKNNQHICDEISSILLDLYLNMPEKGRNETPLHLAVKFGCVEVVEVLTSYAQCSYTRNSEGKYPKDIICFRCPESVGKDVINQIAELLAERFYVPVIRSVDNSIPPIIGEPFSPTNPPNFASDPLSPEMQIHACAGPMSKEKAENFRKRWKTPPRVTRPESPGFSQLQSISRMNGESNAVRQLFSFSECNTNGDNSQLTDNGIHTHQINNNEILRGSDRNSNDISNGLSNAHINTDLFNVYRSKKLIDLNDSTSSSICSPDRTFGSPMFTERHVKLSDTEKGLEVIGREIAKDQNVKWQEYWSFLGDFVDISSSNGLSKLESHLQKAHDKSKGDTVTQSTDSPMSTLCNRLNNMDFDDIMDSKDFYKPKTTATNINSWIKTFKKTDLSSYVDKSISHLSSPSTISLSFGSPYSCVEKSCQVYAKRLAGSILYNLDSVISINDVLKSELKRLSSLISSYKGDARFHYVNFQATHSRFSGLIVHYLMSSKCDLIKFKNSLRQILESTKKIMSEQNNHQKESIFMNVQLVCVLSNSLRILDNEDHIKGHIISPEVLTKEEDYCDLWQSEYECQCEWSSEKTRYQRRLDRESRAKFSDFYVMLQNNNEQKTMDNAQQWRSKPDDSDDEDEIYSDAESNNHESDDDIFYTPPSSPSQFLYEKNDQTTTPTKYSTFLLGDEPTKTDIHVLNALNNVDIDKSAYPCINQWKNALSQYSMDEIENFPSPCVVVKGRPPSQVTSRKLFQSPLNYKSPTVSKQSHFRNMFIKPRKINFNNDNSNDTHYTSGRIQVSISPSLINSAITAMNGNQM